ncbi:unnamed protein product [Closterium sp. NIES-53]
MLGVQSLVTRPSAPAGQGCLGLEFLFFDLDYEATLAAMYALSVSAKDDCYLCVLPNPGIEAAALGASEYALAGTAPAEALHTFTLDSGASRCFFTPSLLSLHLYRSDWLTPQGAQFLPVPPLFSCVRRPGVRVRSSCTPLIMSPPVAPVSSVAPLTWSPLPGLRGMHSRLLISGLPGSMPALPPSPALPCLPCVEGRQRAAPHSSSFPRTFASLQNLHMDVGCKFSSDLLRDFCRGEGILQLFTLPASPQQNGIAERRIGLVMEVARTSMIHAAAPHFLWPFAVRYTAHQLNLWPHVSLPETLPTLRSTGKFYHPTLHRVIPSHDVFFDESVPFYRLFPYCSAPPLPPPLFLAPGPPPVDPLPPQGPAPSGVSQVDPHLGTVPVEVAGDSGAALGAASGGAASRGACPGGAEPGGAESEGAGFGEFEGVESRGTASSGGPEGASPRLSPWPEPLSPQQLREWFSQRTRLRSVAAGVGDIAAGDTGAGGVGATRLGGAGVTAGVGGTGVAAAAGPRGARTRGIGAAGTGSVGGARAGGFRAGEPADFGGAGAVGICAGGAGAGGAGAGDTGAVGAGAGGAGAVVPKAGGAGAGGTRAGGAGAGGAGAVDPGAGGVGAGGAVSGGTGAGGTVQPWPYFVPLLQQVLGLPSSPVLTPPLLCPLLDQSQPPLQPASPLPAPSLYTAQTGGLTRRREPESRPASPVAVVAFLVRVLLLSPAPTLWHFNLPLFHYVFLCHLLLSPLFLLFLTLSLTSRLLDTVVTDPSFDSTTASTLVAELLDFAAPCRLDYATSLCALAMDVLEDKQEEFECLAAAVPRFASMLHAPEGDPDAPDITTPRSYAEAIRGPYSSQWQTAMDDEMEVQRHLPFLQGSLHEEIWLRRPPGFTRSFPAGTHWSLRRPVYGLRQAPCKWHDTLRTTLAALGFTPSTADLSLSFSAFTSSSPRHSPLLCLQGTCSQLHLQTSSSSCEAEIYAGAMAAQELRCLTYLLTDLGEQPRSPLVLYVDNKAIIALCQEHRLEHRMKHIALRYFLARELQQYGQLRLAYVATRANNADIFTNALQPGDHQRFSTVLCLVPTLPHLLTP